MPEMILKFQLPEEECEANLAKAGNKWACIVSEIDGELRRFLKHGHKFKTPDEALQHIRDVLWDEMQENNLSLDML
jgi:hypothetical protein